MQVKKEHLELYTEKQTGSKLGKEYIKAVYCHPTYLNYMQSMAHKMLDRKTHKLESRLLGEIATTSDIQMIHSNVSNYHSNPSLCPTTNSEEAEWFYEDLQDLPELTPKKDVIIGDKCQSRKLKTFGVTGKFGLGVQNEEEQKLTEFGKENHWS